MRVRGHAVALRAFDPCEAGHQGEGDLDLPVFSKDRAIVGGPLH